MTTMVQKMWYVQKCGEGSFLVLEFEKIKFTPRKKTSLGESLAKSLLLRLFPRLMVRLLARLFSPKSFAKSLAESLRLDFMHDSRRDPLWDSTLRGTLDMFHYFF